MVGLVLGGVSGPTITGRRPETPRPRQLSHLIETLETPTGARGWKMYILPGVKSSLRNQVLKSALICLSSYSSRQHLLSLAIFKPRKLVLYHFQRNSWGRNKEQS